jgi:hypothetical protein
MQNKSVSILLAFIFICVICVIVVSSREVSRLNDITKRDAILIDSLKAELDIEIFEKSRYINIIDQVSEVNCKEVKEIINGTE